MLQNPKFDVTALKTVMPRLRWNWSKVKDTLLAGHLLASNQPHDLTTMALIYLHANVQPYEDAVRKATQEVRRMCQGKNPRLPWRIAKKGEPDMPSMKGSSWKCDMWLPRAYAKHAGLEKDHWYWDVASEYGNNDTETTLALWIRQRELLEERGLWNLYVERLKILPVICEMEATGITLNRRRLRQLTEEYTKESERAGKVCVKIAKGKGCELTLPKSGNNKSLLDAAEKITAPKELPKTKKGNPSLDKAAIEGLLTDLPEKSKARKFFENLMAKRSRDTAMSYMESYKKFWLAKGFRRKHEEDQEWYVLHPSLNPTGTDTIRMSSSNPNEQNISKKEGFNLRYCFGPAPGREWWSIDYDNLELRLAAYQADETEMIKLFEEPDEAPYFGSYHLLVFDTLHTKRLRLDTRDPQYLVEARKKYVSTWYGWTKNGNFAVQYGALEWSGTADRAYHVTGAQAKIADRFSKIKELNKLWVDHADEYGYVDTMIDKAVEPERGYPLLAGRTKWGKIRETTPLNYNIQGTACWVVQRAMVKVWEYLGGLDDYKTIMNVHDELVFDFPARRGQRKKPWVYNLPKIKKVRHLMESIGKDISVPLTCGIDYHPVTWGEGVAV